MLQQGTVISSAASLIEDIGVDDDYIAMTKEIALLAPPEDPEESEEPPHITQDTKVEKRDQTTEKGAKVVGPSEKRSQAKPQRDKPPRFDRSGKRKAVSGAEETRKELPGNTKGRKSSRDDAVPQKLTKGSGVRAVSVTANSIIPSLYSLSFMRDHFLNSFCCNYCFCRIIP